MYTRLKYVPEKITGIVGIMRAACFFVGRQTFVMLEEAREARSEETKKHAPKIDGSAYITQICDDTGLISSPHTCTSTLLNAENIRPPKSVSFRIGTNT